jgi:hypothetical protein
MHFFTRAKRTKGRRFPLKPEDLCGLLGHYERTPGILIDWGYGANSAENGRAVFAVVTAGLPRLNTPEWAREFSSIPMAITEIIRKDVE